MDLSPYPNLRKAEKLKSQLTLRILQKDFYSVYLTHQLCIQQIVEGCKSSHDGGCHYIETSPLICFANQWTGFYMITASVMKELRASVFHLLLYLMFFAFSS